MSWVTYENSEVGFALEYPDDWDVIEDVFGSAALLRAPDAGVDEFRPTFGIAVQELDGPTVLDTFVPQNLQQQARLLTDFHLLDIGDAQVAGLPAKRILSAHRQGIFSLTLEQWWAIAEGGVVVLSATAESLHYGHLADRFARMASSFRARLDA